MLPATFVNIITEKNAKTKTVLRNKKVEINPKSNEKVKGNISSSTAHCMDEVVRLNPLE